VAETHWGRKLNSPWRAHLLARRVESEKKSIKGLSFTSGKDHHISDQIIGGHFRRETGERPERL